MSENKKVSKYTDDVEKVLLNFSEGVFKVAEKHGKDFDEVLRLSVDWLNKAIKKCEEA